MAEIAKRLAAAGHPPHAALAFAEFCYGDDPKILSPELHRRLFYPLFRALPGVNEKAAAVLYRRFAESTSEETPEWRFDETLGWINDYPHSRRNPKAAGCVTENEFACIKRFFGP